MNHDFADKSEYRSGPWWLPLFWATAMVLCVYLWAWVITGALHHVECWNNDEGLGCAFIFEPNDRKETGE